jgi:hypothetical protein
MHNPILIEGFRPDEILNLPQEQIAAFVLTGQPLIFRVGTAEILGEFRTVDRRFVVELAYIDGGGEGVLPVLWRLTERYAGQQGLEEIEWIVHAINCARPNLKLRRVLERRGYVIEEVAGIGAAYHKIQRVE